MNFHIEVPNAGFVVFRKPIRLRFAFGDQGWVDPYSRPQFRYFENYHAEWWNVSKTCVSDQVTDIWDPISKIFEISICHLSLFAIFAQFVSSEPTELVPDVTRPKSYDSPVFFLILAGFVVLGVFLCCVCYFVWIRPSRGMSRRPLAFSELGIRPVQERLHRRHLVYETEPPVPSQPAQALEDSERPRRRVLPSALPNELPGQPQAIAGDCVFAIGDGSAVI